MTGISSMRKKEGVGPTVAAKAATGSLGGTEPMIVSI